MSDVGGGPVLLLGAAVALPLLAGAGLLYLTYKGICLATSGVKAGCDEIKRRREEAARLRANDQQLFASLQESMVNATQNTRTLMAEVETKIQQVHINTEDEKIKQERLFSKWITEQKTFVEQRFENISNMGAEQERVTKAKATYVNALAGFKPPLPKKSVTDFDAEVCRMKIRAETMSNHLKTEGVSSDRLKFFSQYLAEGKYADAIAEGYSLLNMEGRIRTLQQELFAVRLDLISKDYIPEIKKGAWLKNLVDAEKTLLSREADETDKIINDVRAGLKDWRKQVVNIEAYKKQAMEARHTIIRLEAFCNDCLLPETADKQAELQQLRKVFEAGGYDDVIAKGNVLLKAWEEEESLFVDSKYADVGAVVPGQIVTVLQDMGYETKMAEDMIKGNKGERAFHVWYDSTSGHLRYDLHHQGFPSQKVCDRELADFLLRLAEKGILVDTKTEPTHPKQNGLETVAEDIYKVLRDLGIDAEDIQREDEGGCIRILVNHERGDMVLEVDADGDVYMNEERLYDLEDIQDAIEVEKKQRERERILE